MEGEFVWPVSGPATFTYWDVEYEEPYPGKLAGIRVVHSEISKEIPMKGRRAKKESIMP